MEVHELMKALHVAERLKDEIRHCTTSKGRPESVAEHSWRISLMAYFIKDEFPEADMAKVINMCLIHDLGECFTGDIPVFAKNKEHEELEEKLLLEWVASLPEPYRTEMKALYLEMAERKTLESKIYKAMDSLEAVIQHNESPIETWEDHEYDLNRTYAWDKVEFSPYLMQLRQLVYDDTIEKIKENGKEYMIK